MNKFMIDGSSIYVMVISADVNGVNLQVEFTDGSSFDNVTMTWENMEKACKNPLAKVAKLYSDIKEYAMSIANPSHKSMIDAYIKFVNA